MVLILVRFIFTPSFLYPSSPPCLPSMSERDELAEWPERRCTLSLTRQKSLYMDSLRLGTAVWKSPSLETFSRGREQLGDRADSSRLWVPLLRTWLDWGEASELTSSSWHMLTRSKNIPLSAQAQHWRLDFTELLQSQGFFTFPRKRGMPLSPLSPKRTSLTTHGFSARRGRWRTKSDLFVLEK